MRLDTLNERIANAKSKIEKKQNTISKKEDSISKKEDKLVSLGYAKNANPFETRDNNTAFWLSCDIERYTEDIERLRSEISETKKSLEKYEAQLAGEIEKESILLKEIPDSMKRMQTELVKEWDAYDIERREQMHKDRIEMSREAYCKKYTVSDRRDFFYKTDEQIHRDNERDAKVLVLNLYNRVKEITGEVTDWSGIHAEIGTYFGAVLNGVVIGKEGRARVESILAGGYNIQRLHVRVLVHPF